MHAFLRAFVRCLAVVSLVIPFEAGAQQPITLHGAVQFDDTHPFNKALLKFEERVKRYYGKPINFVLHRNSELGLEKDYFAYMSQGISVDYGIVSPSSMRSTYLRRRTRKARFSRLPARPSGLFTEPADAVD